MTSNLEGPDINALLGHYPPTEAMFGSARHGEARQGMAWHGHQWCKK
jgi:hypothetical protein